MDRAKRFWELAEKLVAQKFLDVCEGDEELAREAMIHYAEPHIVEEERDDLEGISDDDLRLMVVRMAFRHPDFFIAFMEILREAVPAFLAEEQQ